MAEFLIGKKPDGSYYFSLKASDGQVILTSESFESIDAVKSTIEAVKNLSLFEDRYEKRASSDGKYYFSLKTTDGRLLGSSGMFDTAAYRNNGIEAVKRYAPPAVLVESRPKG